LLFSGQGCACLPSISQEFAGTRRAVGAVVEVLRAGAVAGWRRGHWDPACHKSTSHPERAGGETAPLKFGRPAHRFGHKLLPCVKVREESCQQGAFEACTARPPEFPQASPQAQRMRQHPCQPPAAQVRQVQRRAARQPQQQRRAVPLLLHGQGWRRRRRRRRLRWQRRDSGRLRVRDRRWLHASGRHASGAKGRHWRFPQLVGAAAVPDPQRVQPAAVAGGAEGEAGGGRAAAPVDPSDVQESEVWREPPEEALRGAEGAGGLQARECGQGRAGPRARVAEAPDLLMISAAARVMMEPSTRMLGGDHRDAASNWGVLLRCLEAGS
jgi:hypothetical protein